LCNRTAERVRVHVVRKTPLSVDLHDRDPLAIPGLELRIPVDLDLPQLEAELVSRSGDDAPSGLAKMAARRGEECDLGYG
jgi:hypothetical protein